MSSKIKFGLVISFLVISISLFWVLIFGLHAFSYTEYKGYVVMDKCVYEVLKTDYHMNDKSLMDLSGCVDNLSSKQVYVYGNFQINHGINTDKYDSLGLPKTKGEDYFGATLVCILLSIGLIGVVLATVDPTNGS